MKNIIFGGLQTLDTFPENDMQQDLFYLLIEHCPNVKNIYLSAGINREKGWKYLSAVLAKNTRWKLQFIELGDYAEEVLLEENFKKYYFNVYILQEAPYKR